MIAASLVGCFVTGADLAAVVGSSGPGGGPGATTEPSETGDPFEPAKPGALEVVSVAPTFGVDTGGYTSRVVVEGLEPGDEPSVWFGDEPAVVWSVNGGALEVEVPTSAVAGPVDVRVETAGALGSLPGGFTYWADGAGRTGALGIMQRIDYIGGYWGSAIEPVASVSLGIIAPADFGFAELYVPDGARDTCARAWDYPGSVTYLDPGVSSVDLDTGSALLLVRGEGGFFEADVDPDDVPGGGAVVSLQMGAPAPFDEPFAAAVPLFEMPDPITVTEPGMSGASLPFVEREIRLGWVAGSGDYVLATLNRYRDDTLVDEVSCVLTDDGAFTVPDLWTGWSGSQDYIVILLARVDEAKLPLPHDGSASGVVGARGTVGAVVPLAW
jgi:hypothetical protein